VYGDLADIPVEEQSSRYAFKNMPLGVSEDRGIDFHSPYGCSKGTADQYVRDYHRIYGLRTVVFRQSCIYGQHQFGVEDQGWVAWFLIALTLGKQISIYGNGKQVRDLLYVSDLVRAYHLAYEQIEKTQGQIYNIGGGAKNAVSIWFDLLPTFEKLIGHKITPKFAAERPGDQPIFIADISKAKKEFGWEPTVGVEEGIAKLHSWISQNKTLFAHI
jgi:CDP-paratose 2-epimerase